MELATLPRHSLPRRIIESGQVGLHHSRLSVVPGVRAASFASTESAIGALGKAVPLAAFVGLLRRRFSQKRGLARSSPTALSAVADLDAWRRGFLEPEDVEEGFYFIENVDLPKDLSGTFFRNGPGKFKEAQDMVTHELDGDGLVLGISFLPDSKQVCVRHRLVQTQGLLRDKVNTRIYARGYHGTPAGQGGLPDPRANFPKHTANATVVQWEEKLLAVGHFGKPFEIDPGNLGTVLGNEDEGSWNIDGVLKDDAVGSSPKVCATEECLTFISQSPSAMNTTVNFWEFAPGAWRPRYRKPRSIDVGGYTRFADFAITPKWFVLAKPPLKADGLAATFGKPFSEVLEYDPSGTAELIFATRLRRDEEEIVVPVDNFVCEEFVNAYEEGSKVIVDLVAADGWDHKAHEGRPRWEVKTSWPKQRLVRYEVDLPSQTWTKTEAPLQKNLSFTSVNPKLTGKKHRFIFGAVSHDEEAGPAGGVVKIDNEKNGEVDEWLLGPSEFCSEPVFVPKEESVDEDDGYLLTVTFDGEKNTSDVVILDAKSISAGPICRFSLSNAMPHGRQGCWVPNMTFTPDQMKRKFTLLRMFEKKSQSWNAVDMSFSTLGPLVQRQGTRLR